MSILGPFLRTTDKTSRAAHVAARASARELPAVREAAVRANLIGCNALR